MAPRSRRRTGEGFSLVELQPVLTSVTSSIADELSSQGVDVDTNSLLMGIQSLVNQLVMNNPGALMASDDKKPPYSISADLLAMAYQHFHAGDKKQAVKKFLTACEFEDAGLLNEALLLMNNQSDWSKRLVADESDENEPDEDAEDDDSDDEMSDDEIDDLINDEGKDDTDDTSDDDDDTQDDSAPMGGTSSTKPVVTASAPADRAKRILAIKMSSTGDEAARKRATKLLG